MKINYSGKSVALFIGILIVAIVFESFQQWYYIERFNLASDILIVDLFKSHSISWLIWLGYAPILAWQSKLKSFQNQLVFKDYVQWMLIIIVMVVLCILTISLVRIWMADEPFSLSAFFREYVSFFIFQKSPIYTLSYIALTFVFYLNYKNYSLKYQVQELSELREEDQKMYNELRTRHSEKSQILNIKLGNKRKIVPVEEICWIESDDYCVKVHTINEKSFTMRSTLKALEAQLLGNFMRVHRTAIVNLDYAKEISYSGNPNLTLQNNTCVPIAKSKIRALRSQLS